jgi:cell division protein FtsI (penicillin-binding protein 3)
VALLGNLGLTVRIVGVGKVKRQSIEPGTPAVKGRVVVLEML